MIPEKTKALRLQESIIANMFMRGNSMAHIARCFMLTVLEVEESYRKHLRRRKKRK